MITIQRIYQKDCVVGVLNFGDFRCFTLELPDKNNQQSISCIPAGTYEAFKRISPKNGTVLELRNVYKRQYIQIHSGNYTREIEGCILVGDSLKDINNDGVIDVTNSKNTLHTLLDTVPEKVQIRIY